MRGSALVTSVQAQFPEDGVTTKLAGEPVRFLNRAGKSVRLVFACAPLVATSADGTTICARQVRAGALGLPARRAGQTSHSLHLVGGASAAFEWRDR